MQVGKLEYDENLSIAIGMSVSSKIWKNTKITWNALVQKLSIPVVTAETYKQFMNATKEEQSKIKDVGGFVGGFLTNGRRCLLYTSRLYKPQLQSRVMRY